MKRRKLTYNLIAYFLIGVPIGTFLGFSDSPVLGIALTALFGIIAAFFQYQNLTCIIHKKQKSSRDFSCKYLTYNCFKKTPIELLE